MNAVGQQVTPEYLQRERLAHLLREQRRKLGVTQAEMAALCGITLRTYSRIELAQCECRPGYLTAICRALEKPEWKVLRYMITGGMPKLADGEESYSGVVRHVA